MMLHAFTLGSHMSCPVNTRCVIWSWRLLQFTVANKNSAITISGRLLSNSRLNIFTKEITQNRLCSLPLSSLKQL